MLPGAEKKGTPLTEENFLALMNARAAAMVLLCRRALKKPSSSFITSRALVGELFAQAARVEELLETYGAKNNKHWSHLSGMATAIKALTNALSIVLCIDATIPRFQLLTIEGDFYSDTARFTSSLGTILLDVVRNFLAEAHRVGIAVHPAESPRIPKEYEEEHTHLLGALPADKNKQHVASPSQIVVRLATAFLSESGQSQLQKLIFKLDRSRYASCIPDTFGEKILGLAEREFRNLQSMYDNYISDTDAEQQDCTLPVVRGHISIIQLLLDLGAVLACYYERHIARYENARAEAFMIDPDKLLIVLVEYAIAYAGLFMRSAQQLCRSLLKRYTEPSTVEVTIPAYRGFHVRPSTLIAKIVLHYGSEVYLVTEDGSRYNAAEPLELFRVNEKINAEKRRALVQYLASLQEMKASPRTESAVQEALRRIFLKLLQLGRLVMYSGGLPFDELAPDEGEEFAEFVKRTLALFLAQGLIDIRIEMKVKFVGDKCVLDDIIILAKNGYAEDSHGNDIMLPAKLAYLKR